METLRDLCRRYRQDGFRVDGEGLVGIYDEKAGLWQWFRWEPTLGAYRRTGSTDTPEGAPYRELAGVNED